MRSSSPPTGRNGFRLTFVAIALFGTLVAAWIARVVRHRPLPHVAILVESVVGLFFFGAWAVLTLWSGVWVSAPLLVLFPILLQVGFVFVGGQAGRLLDVQQIKIHFPRIVSGFAVGFLAGGLVAMPLLRLPGGTNGLFLIAAIAQVAFVMLLAVTAGRFAERLGQVERAPHGLPRPPLHQLLSSRFVLLLMTYQVLSAAGTYMAEYILFDRAAARFASADSLAQFLSQFTIALNAVSLAFLALLAVPLLRRFGLRLGIVANPAVVLVFAVAMLVSATTRGPRVARPVRARGLRPDRRRLVDRRRHQGVAQHVLPGTPARGQACRAIGGRGRRRADSNRRDGRRAFRVASPPEPRSP